MATHSEKLATSLEILKSLIGDSKRAIFKSTEFSRVHKERLVKAGFLMEMKKGWAEEPISFNMLMQTVVTSQ